MTVAGGASEEGLKKQVRVIQLDERNSEDVVYRIEKGTTLQFRLSPSLHGYQTKLFTNHPLKSSDTFSRTSYHQIEWVRDRQNEETFTNLNANVAGCFQFYCTKEGEKSGSGYFLIDPVLKIGKDNNQLKLDSICCQTVFAKCLGALPEWKGRLEVSYKSGYNMIHFTPIQELGGSNSSYSIADQLALNPIFGKVSFENVKQVIDDMKNNWGVLSICDVVLNHTANETPWLKTNPECGYNLHNCPHLRPAYLLDCLLWQFSYDISQEKYATQGLPSKITTEDHLNIVRVILKNELLPQLKIEEIFLINVNSLVEEFTKLINSEPPTTNSQNVDDSQLKIVQDKEYRRLKSTVDLKLALKLYNWKWAVEDDSTSKIRAIESFTQKLNQLNEGVRQVLSDHLSNAVENVIAGARYERLQKDGPKLPQVTEKDPFIHRYFEKVGLPRREEMFEEELLTYSDKCKFVLAHNGWVMNDNPLRNFAEAGSNIYLRRELIAWSDSVKLRYGKDPSDCAFLWSIMKKYVETTAKIFHGLRLDNCHSTPIHVAEYLLDAARNAKPDLYVVAELFTNSDRMDNIFVNRLGITSLIREAMSACDSHEEGRIIHRYGGLPVGAFLQEPVRPLMQSIAHAVLMDQTHDNPSPMEKRSIYDILPTASLVAMASCASGSNRGLDELVPHHIHVVDETRPYSSWSDSSKTDKPGYVNISNGIFSAKSVINKLHSQLGQEGFTEVYVDQMEYDIVAVTRHHPNTHERVVLVAYTAFSYPDVNFHRSGGVKDLIFEGNLEEIVLEARLQPTDKSKGNFPVPSGFKKNPNFINSVDGYECIMQEKISIDKSAFVKLEGSAVKFVNFQPGSIIAFKITPPLAVNQAITSIGKLISKGSLEVVVAPLTLTDLNKVLYKCEEEERDDTGCGVFNIPNYGNLVYCGLQGINSVLADVRLKNDTGHPICNNLRQGNWLMEYTSERLVKDDGTKGLGQLLKKCFESLNEFPRYLIPAYFDIIIRRVYMYCIESSWKKMSSFIQSASPFTQSLALGSVQCTGFSKSGPLPYLSPNLGQPKPGTRTFGGVSIQDCGSLCAGLPHFSTGYMRNWGRDTFISVPGLLIATGRFEDARYHILAFASVLRHGLIPNLLDRGTNSRYNCRDSTWFWLQAIKMYVLTAPYGEAILKDRVSRMWPSDFGEPILDHSVEQCLEDVIQEALQKHFQGINFRERNAGEKIDAQMKDEGFNVVAGVDLETGFVFGGNSFNCGTWMDKMGSSDKAGNRGIPATPRDGSAVELIGLSASVLKFLADAYKGGKYRYDSVEKSTKKGQTIRWTFLEWHENIKNNFENKFFISESPEEKQDPQENLINRRGIYKDTVGASANYCDYQLRPNFLVAMAVAPELFTPKNAVVALQRCRTILLSELGLRTLDPSDWNYNGNYDNSNDSSDRKLAHGFNYHNGPEWLWPVGFYLRAYLKFYSAVGEKEDAIKHVRQVMSKHWSYLSGSPWKGLPELTNKDGAECWGSCRVQAWSMATLLEVLKDLEELDPQSN